MQATANGPPLMIQRRKCDASDEVQDYFIKAYEAILPDLVERNLSIFATKIIIISLSCLAIREKI